MIGLLLFLLLQATPELRQQVEAGLKARAAGDLDGAVRAFGRVAELAPQMPAAHVNLGAAWAAKREYGKAAEALRRALELDPKLPGAHALLGTALLAQGYAAEAIPHLQTGGAADLLGVALLEAGRAREALDALEAALEKRPGDPDLMYFLSRAHSQLSMQVAESLQKAAPGHERTLQMLGEAHAAAGRAAEAERHFRAAIGKRAGLRGVHYALGELLLTSGDYERAVEEFREEAKLAPGSAAAAWRLGAALAQAGQLNEAIAELKRALTLAPGMPETQLELGRALLASGDAAAAEAPLLAVAKSEGGSALAEAAHYQLAQAYRKLNRPVDAERHLKLFNEVKSGRLR